MCLVAHHVHDWVEGGIFHIDGAVNFVPFVLVQVLQGLFHSEIILAKGFIGHFLARKGGTFGSHAANLVH